MNIFEHFQTEVTDTLKNMAADGLLPDSLDLGHVTVEPPRDVSHGDMATNAALVLAKQAGKNPREIGQGLADRLLQSEHIEAVDVAGPGFVNFRLKASYWTTHLREILQHGTAYGDSAMGKGEVINIEYVSANPTGPLHVGHTRGAVFGDALAAVMEKAGYKITREYYTNDAGAQIDTLARSVYLRYCEALGDDIGDIPEGLYPGDYLKPVGQKLADEHGDKLKSMDEEEWLAVIKHVAVDAMMDMIREDLASLGIVHDVFVSEKRLTDENKVQEAFEHLSEMGLVYQGVLPPPKSKNVNLDDWEPTELTLLKSSEFGDDSDRALKKSDGSWSYIAPDIAYHYDKFQRGFTNLIDIVGTDHHGWVSRITAGTKAVTDNKADLNVFLVALVNLMEDGQPLKMSKRAGSFKTLRDLVEQVGPDVVRFIMLTRRNDQTLDFDFAKVVEQSKDNPVFYVQYAHARCCSVLRNAAEIWPDADYSDEALLGGDLSRLETPEELQLIRLLASWPRLLESAAEAREPHRIPYFLQSVASEFHAFWTKGKDDASFRFLIEDDKELSFARLALIRAVAVVIASGLEVLGVKPVEEMK